MEENASSELGQHWVVQLLPNVNINLDTIISTWIVVGALLIIAFVVNRRITSEAPRGLQNALEAVMESISSLVRENIGVRSRFIPPLAITLFVFLLAANWLGLIPRMKSPTSDLNTTLGLALMVFIMIHVYGVRAKKIGGYVGHYFKPFKLLFPINLIDEVAKPVTLSFRLFGNIFAGEVVLFLLAFLLPWWLIPLPGVVWLSWSLLVGGIQAFVFTILTVVYISFALEHD